MSAGSVCKKLHLRSDKLPSAQILVSNLILYSKKPQLPEKKAESRTGAGNIQGEPRVFYN